MTADELLARVLYRDALMLVIDKPAGLPVHPGPKGGETLHYHLDALRFGLPRRPEAAHRLDRDTSGCLVLGRHAEALARLGALFKTGAVDKVYWVVVEGGPADEEGEIALPLMPRSPDRGWWMKVDPAGQPALTRWRVLGRLSSPRVRGEGRSPLAGAEASPKGEGEGPGDARTAPHPRSADASLASHPNEGVRSPLPARGERSGPPAEDQGLTLLELRPVTGRTHQLRVHCAAMGWPILGDAVYGSAPRFGGPGLHLLARAVTVPLYPKKPPILVEAPVPAHMRARLAACGLNPA